MPGKQRASDGFYLGRESRGEYLRAMYRSLNPEHIIQTICQLYDRIQERFPGSGLSKVAAELQQIGNEAVARAEWISKPLLPLRIGIGALVALLAAVVLVALANLNITKLWESLADFVQAVVSKKPVQPDFADALRTQQVLDAALRSADNNKWSEISR